MGMLGRFQAMDPKGGFGTDFLTVHVGPHLKEIARQGIKVIANAGGLNPKGLVAALEGMIKEAGLTLTVACVDGDDMRAQVDALRAAGVREMFTGDGAATQADHQRERLSRRLPHRSGARARGGHRDHRAGGG